MRKAERGRRNEGLTASAFCLLPTAYYSSRRLDDLAVDDDLLAVELAPLGGDVVDRAFFLVEGEEAHRLEVHFLVPAADVLDPAVHGRVDVDVQRVTDQRAQHADEQDQPQRHALAQ